MTELETFQEVLQNRFKNAEYPEHVEDGLREILDLIQDEVDFSQDQWEEVIDTLRSDVEFGEADWYR